MTKPEKKEMGKENSPTQLIEDLVEISEPNTLRSNAGRLKAIFYLDDLVGLIKHLIRKLKMKMTHEKIDAELRSIPKGKYRDGYLMGYSDAIETMMDEFGNFNVPKHLKEREK